MYRGVNSRDGVILRISVVDSYGSRSVAILRDFDRHPSRINRIRGFPVEEEEADPQSIRKLISVLRLKIVEKISWDWNRSQRKRWKFQMATIAVAIASPKTPVHMRNRFIGAECLMCGLEEVWPLEGSEHGSRFISCQ